MTSSNSRSTHKLELANQIIQKTLSSRSVEKRDQLQEISIDWVSIDTGSDELVACPNIVILFKE